MSKDEWEDYIEKHRKMRILVGGAVSLPTAIVVSFVYQQYFHREMDTTVAIAIASLIGSAVTVAGICFHDLRRLMFSFLVRRGYIRRDTSID